MSTLASKRVVRKSTALRPVGKNRTLEKEILSAVGTRTPPTSKFSAVDLLRDLEDGSFAAAAAKIDWARVELAHRSRASSSALRTAKT